MLPQKAFQHVSRGGWQCSSPLSLLGSVSLIVCGPSEGAMLAGSKVSQVSINVEAASTATGDVPRDIGDSGASSLAPAQESGPATCHISTVLLPALFRNSIRGTPHAPGSCLCGRIPSLSFLLPVLARDLFNACWGPSHPVMDQIWARPWESWVWAGCLAELLL